MIRLFHVDAYPLVLLPGGFGHERDVDVAVKPYSVEAGIAVGDVEPMVIRALLSARRAYIEHEHGSVARRFFFDLYTRHEQCLIERERGDQIFIIRA